MTKKQKKGFTLIELLVVIAIIGLLATLSVVALNNARERARDSRRVSDIKQIQTALELHFNENNHYPATDSITSGALVGAFGILDGNIGDYMNPIPTAPTPADNASGSACNETAGAGGTNHYRYKRVSDTEYELKFCLGNAVGDLGPGVVTATEMSIGQ